MGRLLIASDIHGSAGWCRRLMEFMRTAGAEKMLLLGDLLYHGPRNDLPEAHGPKAVAEMLNGQRDRILCVRGNCDAEVDQMVLEFPIMAEYALVSQDGLEIFATHGHHFNENTPPALGPGGVLLCGHTHVPACRRHDGFTYLNPGSVSLPKKGSPKSCMLLDGGVFRWYDLETGSEYVPA